MSFSDNPFTMAKLRSVLDTAAETMIGDFDVDRSSFLNPEQQTSAARPLMGDVGNDLGSLDYVDSEPAVNTSDDDYLDKLTESEYIDFVANFLRPTPIEWAFVAIFLILMLVGIVGNVLVVYVVVRNRRNKYMVCN